MRHITLPALKIALADLFERRIDALRASNAGRTYELLLRDKLARIDALPEPSPAGKPLAEAMAETDEAHDGFGAAIWFLTEAYLRAPDVPPHIRSAIERIRDTFIPELDLIRAPYADEVAAAIRHKHDLVTLETDLKTIPLAGGSSLFDWCAGFVAKGEELGSLLSQRADKSSMSRIEASKLRAATVGAIGRLRATLADEMAFDLDLPRDLDAQIFGYFDELDYMNAMAAAARKRVPPVAPLEESAPPPAPSDTNEG